MIENIIIIVIVVVSGLFIVRRFWRQAKDVAGCRSTDEWRPTIII